MRIFVSIFILFVTGSLAAQTPVTKSFAPSAGQKILLRFDYPELIKVSTWEKNEILITGKVSINGGESDEAFELTQSSSGNTTIIESRIKDMKKLPHRITIRRGEEKVTFKSKEDFEKYTSQHGHDFEYTSTGVDIDITLEIKVPRTIETSIESTYGMVEIRDFSGPLTVDATYGGVDVVVQIETTGELIAETDYGQIYSNLDLKFHDGRFEDFHTRVEARPGTGPWQRFESKYGNVYLRKPL